MQWSKSTLDKNISSHKTIHRSENGINGLVKKIKIEGTKVSTSIENHFCDYIPKHKHQNIML